MFRSETLMTTPDYSVSVCSSILRRVMHWMFIPWCSLYIYLYTWNWDLRIESSQLVLIVLQYANGSLEQHLKCSRCSASNRSDYFPIFFFIVIWYHTLFLYSVFVYVLLYRICLVYFPRQVPCKGLFCYFLVCGSGTLT